MSRRARRGARRAATDERVLVRWTARAHAIAVADVNRDGKLDLAAANFDENIVSVLLNVCLP